MSTNKKLLPFVASLCMQYFAMLHGAGMMAFPVVPSFATTGLPSSVTNIPASRNANAIATNTGWAPSRLHGVKSSHEELLSKECARFCLGVLLSFSSVASCPADATVEPPLDSNRSRVAGYPSSLPSSVDDRSGILVAFDLPQVSAIPNGIQRWSDDLQGARLQAADERSARVREYDEMFKKDERDRNEYYGKMALESRKKAEIQESKEQQEGMAITDYLYGNNYLVEGANKDTRSTDDMSVTELRDFEKQQKILERKIALEESLKEIGAEQAEKMMKIKALEKENLQGQTLSIQRSEEMKRQQEQEFQEKMREKQQFIQEIKDQRVQKEFDDRMDTIVKFETRKENYDLKREQLGRK